MSAKVIVGLAIEDSVEVRLCCGNVEVFSRKAAIPEAGNYFENVHALIGRLLEAMADVKGGTDPGDLFNSIASFVVSTPGVVESNKSLAQLALRHSGQDRFVRWQRGGQVKEGFHFGEEIADMIETILQVRGLKWRLSERQRFVDTVFVMNDATACAAFEYTKRGHAFDFVYLKIHNGINVGVVEKGSDGRMLVKHIHAEAGHSYPMLHKHDAEAEFEGVCQYHDWCFEGLVANHSLLERAVSGKGKVFQQWKKILEDLRKRGFKGQGLENELVACLLGKSKGPPGAAEAVDLISHYVAQLVHQVQLGPAAPEHIVLGGRMAQKRLMESVRDKVVKFANGYPRRPAFTPKTVKDYILASTASDEEMDAVEVCGAIAVARSRADIKPSSVVTPLFTVARPTT